LAATRQTRRTRGSGSVEQLKATVDSLIKENRKLQRQLRNLEAKTVGRGVQAATRGIAAIVRRVERALASQPTGAGRARRSPATGRRASTASRAKSVSTRKPASPETQAKRLAALAKAREARAAKRAEAS
jgi:hypothetical protein